MPNIATPPYDKCRNWIKDARRAEFSWEEIKYALKQNDAELVNFLSSQIRDNFWPADVNEHVWMEIICSEKNIEEREKTIFSENIKPLIDPQSQRNNFTLSVNPNSAWRVYERHLQDKNLSNLSIGLIRNASLDILNNLSVSTKQGAPIKGLVIGNVQSGKTANMAALMSMAADWGWNMFIVLSGTIESLRKQTDKRLLEDLDQVACTLQWRCLSHLSLISPQGQRSCDLRFDNDCRDRFFTVSLKNSARLKNLIQWLQRDSNKQQQMRILVIDDEADQASINTKSLESRQELNARLKTARTAAERAEVIQAIDELEERTRINQLMMYLVNGKTFDGDNCRFNYQAMNLVSYTATPYANVLNEAFEESLYPAHFIKVLTPPKEYFGPQEIFGSKNDESDGLPIVREIPENPDHRIIVDIHAGNNEEFPNTLQDGVCWLLCSVAALRTLSYSNPLSMLIHTSQKQLHHLNMYKAVSKILSQDKNTLLQKCEDIYRKEKAALSKEKFRNSYPDYGKNDDEIIDYPEFADIKGQLIELINSQPTHIKLNEEGKIEYHKGIHICVDNCANNGIVEDMIVRLMYPTAENRPAFAPAFIVIGGNTLSRGLTLEGLICTYFGRNVKTCDTLMQMGRWFGYRNGYELYPRIWMTQDTRGKFDFLSELDEDLRIGLKNYAAQGVSPREYAPKIINSPKLSWLKIVSNNRQQSAEEIDLDFTGINSETIVFDNDGDTLLRNITVTNDFITRLGEFRNSFSSSAFFKTGIEFKLIDSFLTNFTFSKHGKLFSDMNVFREWVEKITGDGKLGTWNVAVAGTSVNGENRRIWEPSPGLRIGMLCRNNKGRQEEGVLSIGVLRDTKDLIADIDVTSLSADECSSLTNKKFITSNYQMLREKSGFGDCPLMILYCIDRYSHVLQPVDPQNQTRYDLNARQDVIGVSILIPTSNDDRRERLQINLKNQAEEDESNEN